MRSILIIAVLLSTPFLWGQDVDAPEEDAIVMRLPSTVSGDLLLDPSRPVTQQGRKLEGEVSSFAECSDNVLLVASNAQSDCSLVLRPTIAVSSDGARSGFNAFYGGVFTKYNELSSLRDFQNWFGVGAQHRFSKQLSMRVEQYFEKRDLSATASAAGAAPDFGQMQGLNGTLLIPAGDRTSLNLRWDTLYRINKKSLTGLFATYSYLSYGNTPEFESSLPTTRIGTVDAVYSRLLGRRHWAGIDYSFQHLRWGSVSWDGTHGFFYTHTIAFQRWLVVSGFVGPEYTARHVFGDQNSGAPATRDTRWLVAGGGSLNIGTSRTSLSLTLTRRVTDGGGLTGSALLNGGSAAFKHKLSPHVAWTVDTSYGKTESLYASSRIRSLVTGSSIEYIFKDHFFVTAAYGYDWQKDPGSSLTRTIERNRAQLGIGYSFGMPLGR